MEAVTLHRRFPYAVLGGLFFLDAGAADDATAKRRSTFLNAHSRLQLFTGRDDPAGRDEQFEKMYLLLLDVSSEACSIRAFEVGNSTDEVSLQAVLDELVSRVALRNPDFYECVEGNLVAVAG